MILDSPDISIESEIMKEKIKIALCQISSKRENKKANIQKMEDYVLKAKQQNADLAIFPEM